MRLIRAGFGTTTETLTFNAGRSAGVAVAASAADIERRRPGMGGRQHHRDTGSTGANQFLG